MNNFKSVQGIFDIFCPSEDMEDFLNLSVKLEPMTLKSFSTHIATLQFRSRNRSVGRILAFAFFFDAPVHPFVHVTNFYACYLETGST